MTDDQMLVIISARKGTVSYKTAQERLPEEIETYFAGTNLLIIFPDQYGTPLDSMTFAEPSHQEEESAYHLLNDWIHGKLGVNKKK